MLGQKVNPLAFCGEIKQALLIDRDGTTLQNGEAVGTSCPNMHGLL